MTAKHPALRLVRAVDPAPAPVREAAPGRSDAYRVEVWVGGGGAGRPWLASSAIVGSMAEARTHATQSVSGLVTDGIDPGSVFVGAIRGTVPTAQRGGLDPQWEPDARGPVAAAVVDDGDRLGLWVHVPRERWRAQTGLPITAPSLPVEQESSEPVGETGS